MQDSGAEIGRDETKQRRALAKAVANCSRPEVATAGRYIVRMREKYFGAREDLRRSQSVSETSSLRPRTLRPYFSSATCMVFEPSTVRILARSASDWLAFSTEPSTCALTASSLLPRPSNAAQFLNSTTK